MIRIRIFRKKLMDIEIDKKLFLLRMLIKELKNIFWKNDFIFKSRPDNLAMPFKGGDLADSLSSTIVSERELNTIAYKNGIKVMEVRRNLSNSYNQMTISQTVFVSEKDKPTNWSSYSKVIIH